MAMATSAPIIVQSERPDPPLADPLLEAGDRLTREGEYQELVPDAEGILKSQVFPGLWLDVAALLRGDMKAVLALIRLGLDSPEHRAFLAR